jgi:hypothetical protein
MSNDDFIKTLLLKGLLIQLSYLDKKNIARFVYLMKGRWINILNLQKKLKDDIIYDIHFNKEFSLNNISLLAVHYPFWPNNVTMDDIINPLPNFKKLGDYFLEKDEKYLYDLKKVFISIKMQLNDTLNFYLKDLNTDDKDSGILRFYPKDIGNYKNYYNKLKKDIIEKYFMEDGAVPTSINNENSNILALKMLGISDKNFDVIDEKFINALKRKWFKLIENEIEKTYRKLKNVNISHLTQDEIDEYKNELELLKEYLTSISINDMDKFTTVKEIISYWPDSLQPRPSYVYEY